ncbi:MAG: NAD-dependent epimerase/dehydratase family protein [Phototrophicales bacterium]
MKIIGRGLIANALFPYSDQLEDVVIFASGVADSTTTDSHEFEREYHLLYETITACLKSQKRIVYFSSGGTVYGNYEGIRSENTPLLPQTCYGRHKVLCEAIVRQSTLPYLIVRLPNLVGSMQNKTQLIPSLIHQARQGKVTLFQLATRDLVDVEDFAQIVVELLHNLSTSETIVLASGYSISIELIFDTIQEILNIPTQVELLPKGDNQQFSIDKLRSLIGDNHLPFHAEYYKQVITKYVDHIANLLP